MKYNPIDTSRIELNADEQPVPTAEAITLAKNLRFHQSRPISTSMAWWGSFWGASDSTLYEGLRVHTHPNKWRAVPLYLRGGPGRTTVQVTLAARTFSSSLAGVTGQPSWNSSAPVEFWLDGGNNPPPEAGLFATNFETLNSTENNYALFNSNTVKPLILTDGITTTNNYKGDGDDALRAHLWIRSTIGAAVSLSAPLLIDVYGARDTSLELPLLADSSSTDFPITGRIVEVNRVPYAFDEDVIELLFKDIAPWPRFYFVENEPVIYRQYENDKAVEVIRLTYPTFPETLMSQARLFASTSLTVGWEVDAVYETSGVAFRSILAEVL